jgi:hypothetical protein
MSKKFLLVAIAALTVGATFSGPAQAQGVDDQASRCQNYVRAGMPADVYRQTVCGRDFPQFMPRPQEVVVRAQPQPQEDQTYDGDAVERAQEIRLVHQDMNHDYATMRMPLAARGALVVRNAMHDATEWYADCVRDASEVRALGNREGADRLAKLCARVHGYDLAAIRSWRSPYSSR